MINTYDSDSSSARATQPDEEARDYVLIHVDREEATKKSKQLDAHWKPNERPSAPPVLKMCQNKAWYYVW